MSLIFPYFNACDTKFRMVVWRSTCVFVLQVQICKRSVEVMDAVRRGAQLAIDECQFQFRNRRWNCSTLETMPVFGKVVTQGKRTHTHSESLLRTMYQNVVIVSRFG